MWEEHPEYQKQQARFIVWTFLAIIVLYLGYAITHRDWDLLREVLKFVGAFIAAFGLLVGLVWLFVKIFTRRHADANAEPSRKPDL